MGKRTPKIKHNNYLTALIGGFLWAQFMKNVIVLKVREEHTDPSRVVAVFTDDASVDVRIKQYIYKAFIGIKDYEDRHSLLDSEKQDKEACERVNKLNYMHMIKRGVRLSDCYISFEQTKLR